MKCCDKCGANLDGRWERLTPGLCRTLIKIWGRVIAKNENRVHLAKDLDLSNNEYNNAQKLRYFALIAKVKGMSGYWLVTRRGAQFIRGQQKVHREVKIFRNHIQERSPDNVGILDVMSGPAYWPNADWFMPVEFNEQQGMLEFS